MAGYQENDFFDDEEELDYEDEVYFSTEEDEDVDEFFECPDTPRAAFTDDDFGFDLNSPYCEEVLSPCEQSCDYFSFLSEDASINSCADTHSEVSVSSDHPAEGSLIESSGSSVGVLSADSRGNEYFRQ